MSTTPELSRIKSVRVPRRMYVSKFQRYGGAAIVVVLAVAVGAGIEQMRAGVERARSRGFAVVVWVGGRVEGETRRRGPLLKLGALELQLGKPPPRKTPASEAEIRIPPTLFQRLLPPDALTTVRTRGALVGLGFLCGYLASRLKSPVRVRVNLDWNEEATSVRAVRRFTKLLGGGIEA